MRRLFSTCAGLAANGAKLVLAYRLWFGLRIFVAGVAMTVFAAFWRAVYRDTASIAGLGFDTALRYALVAQILAGVGESDVLGWMSGSLREGRIGLELVRPVDLQLAEYSVDAGMWVTSLASRAPLVLLGFAFGLTLPTDPLRWLSFAVSFWVGASVMFLFEWTLAGVAFYTVDVWGLRVTLAAVTSFFGGAFVPLDFMPPALRALAEALPFQQIVYVPASFLAGITPPAALPSILARELAWLAALLVLSRWVFARASRVVTVQGG